MMMMRETEEGKVSMRPSEHHSVEFGPDALQQLRVQQVLTQAEGAPVTGAHAAQPGVAGGAGQTQRRPAGQRRTLEIL